MIKEKQLNPMDQDNHPCSHEAGCLYSLITGRRPVSRRNRASWYLDHLNKVVHCELDEKLLLEDRIIQEPGCNAPLSDNDDKEHTQQVESEGSDICLLSVTSSAYSLANSRSNPRPDDRDFLVTPNTRVLFLSRSIATSIILDLSPSVVSVSPQNDCVFLDSMFDALKRVLHLLVKSHEVPSSSGNKPIILSPKVFLSVIAYTPFVVAKNNQVLVQNRRISSNNIDLVLAEIWNRLNRLIQEVHELVGGTFGMNLDFDDTKGAGDVFIFPHTTSGVIRHPGSVLEDIYELGLFSSSLMPRLSRLSLIIITDGLFASTNNLNLFRLKSIAVSFITLGTEATYPDSCFGYTPYVDLMKFTSKTTLGTCMTHQELINCSHSSIKNKEILLLSSPLYKLFCWTLHSEMSEDQCCQTPRATNFLEFEPITEPLEVLPEHVARFFCVDQPASISQSNDPNFNLYNNLYHDWRSFRQLERNLDADFEQVLACLLREGYLIKSIQFKHKETPKIVARLVLHWRHNLDLEQELTAPYWNQADLFDMKESNQMIMRPFNTPIYGDTYCELIVHGSYSFLHNLYCNRRTKRRSEYREIAYRQFRQLIDSVLQTYERLQYLSKFYRDSSLSKIPSYLLHGNSLLYEQPHTHRLTSTIDNVSDETKTSEFQEYWQKISCLDTRSWKNLMHIHTLRLVLEHDQPKHKNIHCQNANGRYTHVQCRRSLSSISNFIKEYASFALLEDSTYIKFIYNSDDNLREIETSATKGFIVIRINKLLPIVVIYLMFTSGILDSNRVQIVSYLEQQLTNCKLRNTRTAPIQVDNILRSKTIYPSSESSCVLIKSPLERMLKIYGRNFINDFLLHNWSHGLPGSCPYIMRRSVKTANSDVDNNNSKSRLDNTKEQVEGYTPESSIHRYNLVFGKYLYGVRAVQTISNLPHDIVPSLTANVLSKISAILVNVRIKQGFHIAFNNSGILNLVVEVAMKDHSSDDNASSCLCQYIVFPPTATNTNHNMHSILGGNNNNTSIVAGGLTRSLTNSGSYIGTDAPDSVPHIRGDNGEIKIVKEYWIEQQYGISSGSDSYHRSLQGLRYSEIVDHLFLTDSSIFNCLFTYELLELMCDKLSLYYDLDSSLSRAESKAAPILSPTNYPNVNLTEQHGQHNFLPSSLIDGNSKDYSSRVPLLETEYKFSLINFFKYCQQASLSVLLFKDRSDFYEPTPTSTDLVSKKHPNESGAALIGDNKPSKIALGRKTSIDVKESSEADHPKREHRSSYQHDSSFNFVSSIYSQSFNHMFLETLHKRLKQIHDKEFKLSEYDRDRLPVYLKLRRVDFDSTQVESDTDSVFSHTNHSIPCGSPLHTLREEDNDNLDNPEVNDRSDSIEKRSGIDWRCFIRKGTQENLMIVLIPASLDDVNKWLNFANSTSGTSLNDTSIGQYDPVCPIFVFRCSSTIINDQILSFMEDEVDSCCPKSSGPEADISLHFGKPCKYIDQLRTFNDELNNEMMPSVGDKPLNQTTTDEKTLEIAHFETFLKKIKNTVLKSRFSSLNDAYLSELFIHKDDILYYINNIDLDTQKKYHVSSQLKSLAEFIKNYEDYCDSLPKEPGKPCNKLLNSILLQKCGLFVNQPIARFDEMNPLMKQLHDKKLLFLMRCNYKIELPILEENLAGSTFLKGFVTPQNIGGHQAPMATTPNTNSTLVPTSITETPDSIVASSLGKTEGSRMMEMRCGSVGTAGSPSAMFADRIKMLHAPHRSGSNTTLNSFTYPSTDNHFILEAFKGLQSWSMKEVPKSTLKNGSGINLRHEAHMAEVLKKASERKESHHYRRVLKSKGNYNQSHGAIDQALKRVDSLGRLEHFCLTPLLFSPSWRSRLAPVRDHTIESNNHVVDKAEIEASGETTPSITSMSSGNNQHLQTLNQEESDEDDRWHQMVCNNYIKEYEQYIQTLGFNSVQIRYQSSVAKAVASSSLNKSKQYNKKSSLDKYLVDVTGSSYSPVKQQMDPGYLANSSSKLRKESLSTSTGSLPNSGSVAMYQPGYLIKFLNSGCLVFKVGFCKPYVYSILYSIEGERFNNSNTKVSMTAFLDELDNIKVTMHLHSFTYDYHLRSMCSYISGRQLTFSPGYHLISFLDDFIKYYQKAPNYARSHILCGEVNVTNIKVSGQQLYNYIVTHNSVYKLEVLEMSPSVANILTNVSSSTIIDEQKQQDSISLEDQSVEQGSNSPARNHANNYVLIQLKREKVRYRDGKDPDIFECGLLITHNFQQTANSSSKNSLTLKYFLLLTNQRDLYPKLIHNYDSVVSFGCHRPIRLGLAQLENRQQNAHPEAGTATTVATTNAPSICDEEITYLGYFSNDEMDMLKFLQEKTANLRDHIEKIVRMAEIHYRRDYLWHKLMQRSGTKSEEIPLTTEELLQLLKIVEALDLATLDAQLSFFTTMHINWYTKLFKAFNDLKQSSINQHKIYSVRASKLLLLFIDPKCTTAFILLSLDPERGSAELTMMIKDKQECTRIIEKASTSEAANESVQVMPILELDQDCRQLINDFINFCATFLWSMLLN